MTRTGGGFMNNEGLSKSEFRAMSGRFSKTGQLDKEMVEVINKDLLNPLELRAFAMLARVKILTDVWTGKLSRKELDAVYKVVKVRNYYDVKTGKSTLIMLLIITSFVLILTAISSEDINIFVFILFAVLAIAIVIGLNRVMNRLMLGRLKREFEKAVAKGYPKLKDRFEF